MCALEQFSHTVGDVGCTLLAHLLLSLMAAAPRTGFDYLKMQFLRSVLSIE
jgi:hypothetical protein